MEFIPIKISQQGQHPHSELSFKSDCTEIKRIAIDRFNGQITNIQTYCPQDTSKEQNLIFPTKFIKFFKLLSSSEFGRRFLFDDCSRGYFNEAGIDVSYDIDFGDICSGDSKVDFMRYIYRDMVVPFTKLEKENNQLREQLMRKDQELKGTQQELKGTQQELKGTQQELKGTQQELKGTQQELEKTKGELNKKVQQHTSEKLKVYYDCVCKFHKEIERKDQELNEIQEQLKDTEQKLNEIQEQLKDTKEELRTRGLLLKSCVDDLKTYTEEVEDAKEELRTRGILLKSCVDDLKTFTEEIENVEKKNQELEHLNHRLICETSSSFIERNSYFSPEM